MPLFTYLVTYKGATYIAQGSHSNFTGFAMTWAGALPEEAPVAGGAGQGRGR